VFQEPLLAVHPKITALRRPYLDACVSGLEKVGLPGVVYSLYGLQNERDMRRSARLAQQRHVCFFKRAIALFVIAGHAGSDEVLPTVASASRARGNMIDSQLRRCSAAILTAISVASKNVLARQHDALVRNAVILEQAYYAGEGPFRRDASYATMSDFIDEFSLVQEEQDNSFLYAADTDGFVALVQNEHTSVDAGSGFRRVFEDGLRVVCEKIHVRHDFCKKVLWRAAKDGSRAM
jgi:hypothetical protein